MKELIERLEAATEGSRELDVEIAALYAPTDDARMAAFENGRDYPDLYTTSLDAALTLVPERFQWRVWLKYSRDDDCDYGYAELWTWLDPRDDESPVYRAQAETPALALCIAALKARG